MIKFLTFLFINYFINLCNTIVEIFWIYTFSAPEIFPVIIFTFKCNIFVFPRHFKLKYVFFFPGYFISWFRNRYSLVPCIYKEYITICYCHKIKRFRSHYLVYAIHCIDIYDLCIWWMPRPVILDVINNSVVYVV